MKSDSPIFHMQHLEAEILAEVAERALEKSLASQSPEFVLNEVAYRELLRLHKKHPKVPYWQNIYGSLNRLTRDEQIRQLTALTQEYARDVIGHFDPKVYRFSTSMVPHIMSLFLDAQLSWRKDSFQEKVMIEGHVDAARKLSEKGTVILVPTHSSNMDSIAVGWSAFRSGLPPVTYGAGKNLFTNRILSFFMQNLGAYRVDRRIKHELYKNVLKTYSLVILERGFHSLFFPGGTRSRSGLVEQHLKLGLMGTGLEAYIYNLRNQKAKPNIYIVPCTINYYLVLEAETLIDDYLKEQGQSRYIIEDDESSKFIKTASYLKKTLQLDASLFIRYCPPMDIFGNLVDDEGVSYDRQGRVIDPSKYVRNWAGDITDDLNRDHEYTRETGRLVAESYLKNNVILSPHLVSYVLFRYMVYINPRLDLYQLIRIGAREAVIQRTDLVRMIEAFKQFLADQEYKGVLRLATTLKNKPADQILDEALKYLQMFYSKEIVFAREDRVHVQDMRLLFFYHNRLRGYHFERSFPRQIIEPILETRTPTGELSLVGG